MVRKLFHGSQSIIEAPVWGQGKRYNDYGLGFYCTDSLEMAKEWGVGTKAYLLENFTIPYEKYDAIIGYRADDSYFSFAQDFINGTISYRQLNNAMHLGKLGQQFVLKSKQAFERIQFLGYEVAEREQWYAKKMARDHAARREYFDVERNRRKRGDIYITQILDEEMRSDDARLR